LFVYGVIHLLGKLFLPFDSKPGFVSVRWVSCKQHIGGSCFVTQFAILCHLIGALRPLTFSVSIERCVLFPAIFITLMFTFPLVIVYLLLCLVKKVYSFLLFCLTLISSFVCKSPFSIFYSAKTFTKRTV
jgi:hypothetical protein